LLFRSGLLLEQALTQAEQDFPGAETEAIVAFIRSSERGVIAFA